MQCEISKSISSILTAPIQNGSTPRWKRKSSTQNNDFDRLLTSGLNNMAENRSSTPSRPNSTRTPSKTPNKYVKTPSKTPTKFSTPGDRFIPNRNAIDFEKSHYKLVYEQQSSNVDSPSKQEEEKRMKENFCPNLSKSKIISFKIKAPAADGANSNSKVLYSQNIASSSPRKRKGRYIPQVAERILDAPEYVNDYYLNLIDWGPGTRLGVALANNIYIWDSATGQISHLCELDSDNSYVTSLKWDKANGYLAVGTSDSVIQLWDVQKMKRLRQMTGHASRVASLSWNNHVLSSGSRSGAIHHHDVRVVQHQIGVLAGHSQEVCGLEWSPDGRYLASGGNDNLVNIWDNTHQDSHTPLHSLAQHCAGVKAVAWCPWQNSILATGGGSADRCIKFWNAKTGVCLNSVDSKSQVCGILWSERYKELISGHGYSQNQLSVWKYPSMKKVADLAGHTSRVLQITMSPDETFVMSAGADETLRLWKVFPNEQKMKQKTPSKQDALSIFQFR